MKKKVLSFILALSMILGSMGMTFAAPAVFEDVDDSNVAKAVERLKAFKIVDGYEDGTYRPGQDVTREEFAKLLVTALGIDHAASSVTVADYKDVEAGRWSAGYIAVASGQGLIIGDPDGNFRPADKVSYAEAVTMLVRSLGYKDEFLKGTWPGNSVAKAAEVGITSTVRFTNAEGYANRGEVAVLVNNTLDSDVVKVRTYKDGTTEYYESYVTLLKDRLDISKYEEVRILADKIIDDGLLEDEVKVLFTKNIDAVDDSVKNSRKAGDDKDFVFNEDVNPRLLIGEKATVYMNDREEVVYIEAEDDERVYFDYVYEVDGNRLSLVKFDKKYEFDDNAVVYSFNQTNKDYKYFDGKELNGRTASRIADLNATGKVGKFVIKNNRIIFAEILDSVEANPWLVVLENNDGELEGVNGTTEDFRLDLREDGTYDYALAFDIDGNEINVKDIERGNLVYAQLQDYDGDDVAVVRVVTDNVVEGEIGRFRKDRVQIDGSFKVVTKNSNGYDSYYSVDTLEDIERWGNKEVWETDFDDAYGEEAVAYLDAVGRIAFLSTDIDQTSGYKFGIVTRTYADGDRVKIFTSLDGKDGEELTFRADKEENLINPKWANKDGNASAEDVLGAAVKFKLNKDGEIAKDDFYVMERSNLHKMRADFGRDTIRTNKGSFSVKDSVVIIDAEGLKPENASFKTDRAGSIEALDRKVDVDDFAAVKWDTMKNTKKDDDVEFYVFTRKNNDKEVEGLVFVGDKGANTASDKEAIYVMDRWSEDGDLIVKYVTYSSNEVKEAVVDNYDNIEDVNRRSPYVAEMRSNGKLKLYKLGDINGNIVEDKDVLFEYVYGEVTETSGTTLKIDGKAYTITNSAVVYDSGDRKSTSNIRKGENVFVIVEDNIKVRVVQLNVKKTPEGYSEVTPPELDKTELEAAQEKANAKEEADYTEESWAELVTAKELPETTQEEVDAKVEAINAAIEALVEKDNSGGEDDEITAEAKFITKIFGIESYDLTLTGANIEDITELLVDGKEIKDYDVEDEVLSFNVTSGTPATIEVMIGDKKIEATIVK